MRSFEKGGPRGNGLLRTVRKKMRQKTNFQAKGGEQEGGHMIADISASLPVSPPKRGRGFERESRLDRALLSGNTHIFGAVDNANHILTYERASPNRSCGSLRQLRGGERLF